MPVEPLDDTLTNIYYKLQHKYLRHPRINFRHGMQFIYLPFYKYIGSEGTAAKRNARRNPSTPLQLRVRTNSLYPDVKNNLPYNRLFIAALFVPNWNRYTPLTTYLILAAKLVNPSNYIDIDIPLTYYESNKTLVFQFINRTGYELLTNFLSLCDTEPAFRKALNLPPLTDNV